MSSEKFPIGGNLFAWGPRRTRNNPDVKGEIIKVITEGFFVRVFIKEEKYERLTPVNPDGGWVGLYVNGKRLNK